MKQEKGILLLATSHPYYGRMAYNLAVSIKATGTGIPIAVLHNGRGLSHLSDAQKSLFDAVLEIPQQAFTAKLWLYKYSPFQKTLYIDADTAWLYKRKPEDLFAEMADDRFNIIVEGSYDPATDESKLHPKYNLWSDLAQLKDKYQLKGKLFQFRSEMMYFKKDKQVEKLFAEARKIQANPKVDVTLFGGYVPDEFALNVAASILDMQPDRLDWKPSYWYNIVKKGIPLPILAQQYYVFSAGGNVSSAMIKKQYNHIMAAAFHKLRLQYLFMLHSKRESIAERNLM